MIEKTKNSFDEIEDRRIRVSLKILTITVGSGLLFMIVFHVFFLVQGEIFPWDPYLPLLFSMLPAGKLIEKQWSWITK